MSSNHNTSESGQTDSSGRTSLVFSIRGPIPIQLGKNSYIGLYTVIFNYIKQRILELTIIF